MRSSTVSICWYFLGLTLTTPSLTSLMTFAAWKSSRLKKCSHDLPPFPTTTQNIEQDQKPIHPYCLFKSYGFISYYSAFLHSIHMDSLELVDATGCWCCWAHRLLWKICRLTKCAMNERKSVSKGWNRHAVSSWTLRIGSTESCKKKMSLFTIFIFSYYMHISCIGFIHLYVFSSFPITLQGTIDDYPLFCRHFPGGYKA